MADRPDPEASNLSAPPAGEADTLEAVLGKAVAAPAAYPAVAAGTLVADRYTIERAVGAGGMGTVYLAHDRMLDRAVALKLHHTATASDRLHREAIAMAKLAHPNVVTVFEVGELEGRPFVAMEYVSGASLRAWLAERDHPRREILAALLAAGEGLVAAHDVGLVHRDVKPDNIFVGRDGRVRIGDFGLAQLARTSDGPIRVPVELQTATGTIAGTPAYMSPEQIEGESVDARTDQFAFGVAAWEALAGERPFGGADTEELRAAIVRGALQSPRRRVPARIQRVLARAMAADPTMRWPSMRALLAALRAAERRPRVVAGAAGAILALGPAIAWLAWPAADPMAACAEAGAEIDAIISPALVDGAIAAARRGGGANAEDAANRITGAAHAYRSSYRRATQAACQARARGQWSPEIAAASGECTRYQARTARELFAAAPAAATQPSDVLQIVLQLPPLGPCTDARVLAGWRPLAADSAELDAIVAARARLDAAELLLDFGQLATAQRTYDAMIASPVRTHPAIARRIDLLHGSIALTRNDLAAAEPALADVYFAARAHDDGDLALDATRQLIDLTGRARRDRAAAERWIRDGLAEAERQRVVAPAAAFDVLIAAATVLEGAGAPERALELVARAETLGEADGIGHVAILGVRANAYSNLGRTAEALATAAQLVDEQRRLFGPKHPKVAEALAQHAAILLDASRDAEAERVAREAVAILATVGTDGSSAVATAELNLGATLVAINDPGAAVHLERARAMLVASYGDGHPDIALVDSNLAVIYLDRGEIERAIGTLRNGIAIQERTLGTDHDELASSLYNLAVAERQAGRLDDALATARRSAGIFGKRQPGASRHAAALTHIALIQNLRKRFHEANAAASSALELPSARDDAMTGAWARLEAARALIGARRDPARARRLLTEARAAYAANHFEARVKEIDGMLAGLR